MDYKNPEVLARLFKTDPYLKAEQETGKSSFDDRTTAMIGSILNSHNQGLIDVILTLNLDTTIGMTQDEFVEVAESLDFEKRYTWSFSGYDGRELTKDQLVVMWNNEYNILLKYDTRGLKINAARIFYNHKQYNDNKFLEGVYESCDLHGNIFIGQSNVVQGLKFILYQLFKSGQTIPWVKRPSILLAGYGEIKGDKLTEKRIKDLSLPQISP